MSNLKEYQLRYLVEEKELDMLPQKGSLVIMAVALVMMLLNLFIACVCGISAILIFVLFIAIMIKEGELERIERIIEKEKEWEKEQRLKGKKTKKVDDDDSEDQIAVEAIACKQFT